MTAPEPSHVDYCNPCGELIEWVDCPTGGWWAHWVHPDDGHDAGAPEAGDLEYEDDW